MSREAPEQLKWPTGWERTRIDARKPMKQWNKTLVFYREALKKEIKKIGSAEDFIISFNEDPLKERMDPGVAVYFSREVKEDFSWQEALGISDPAPTLAEIDAAYREKAMPHHPDRGGDRSIFEAYTKHRDAARHWVQGTHKKEHEFSIPCDKFTETRWNLNAIRQAIAAFRVLDRVGIPGMLERSFRGFRTALTTGSVSQTETN